MELENEKYYWIKFWESEPPIIGEWDSDINQFMITGQECGIGLKGCKVISAVSVPDFDKIGIL